VAWISFTQEYFLQRDMLVSVLLLVDSSIPPQPVDLECANWLAEAEVCVCARAPLVVMSGV
jgi:GTP-binding protein